MGSDTPWRCPTCPFSTAGITILPVLSAIPQLSLPEDKAKALTVRIQDAGTEVVQAKAGAGSATLSMAYAAARFGEAALKALSGESVVEFAYVESSVVPGLPFFSSPVRLGPNGIEGGSAAGGVELCVHMRALLPPGSRF